MRNVLFLSHVFIYAIVPVILNNLNAIPSDHHLIRGFNLMIPRRSSADQAKLTLGFILKSSFFNTTYNNEISGLCSCK